MLPFLSSVRCLGCVPQQEVPQWELPARSRCQELQRGVLARSRRESCQPHGASAALPCPPRRGAAARPQRPAHRARPDGAGRSSRPPPGSPPAAGRAPHAPGPAPGAPLHCRGAPGGGGRVPAAPPAALPVALPPARGGRAGSASLPPAVRRDRPGRFLPSNFPRVCSGFPLPAGPASAPSATGGRGTKGGRAGGERRVLPGLPPPPLPPLPEADPRYKRPGRAPGSALVLPWREAHSGATAARGWPRATPMRGLSAAAACWSYSSAEGSLHTAGWAGLQRCRSL